MLYYTIYYNTILGAVSPDNEMSSFDELNGRKPHVLYMKREGISC